MHQERCLDLDSTNAMTSNLDNLIGAAREPYISIFINRCRIASVIHARQYLPIVATVTFGLAPQSGRQSGERSFNDHDAFFIRSYWCTIGW